jgi:hypothetical protein
LSLSGSKIPHLCHEPNNRPQHNIHPVDRLKELLISYDNIVAIKDLAIRETFDSK